MSESAPGGVNGFATVMSQGSLQLIDAVLLIPGGELLAAQTASAILKRGGSTEDKISSRTGLQGSSSPTTLATSQQIIDARSRTPRIIAKIQGDMTKLEDLYGFRPKDTRKFQQALAQMSANAESGYVRDVSKIRSILKTIEIVSGDIHSPDITVQDIPAIDTSKVAKDRASDKYKTYHSSMIKEDMEDTDVSLDVYKALNDFLDDIDNIIEPDNVDNLNQEVIDRITQAINKVNAAFEGGIAESLNHSRLYESIISDVLEIATPKKNTIKTTRRQLRNLVLKEMKLDE